MSMMKPFQECKNILYGLVLGLVVRFGFFFQGSWHTPCSKKIFVEKTKINPITGLLTEMLIAVYCSHVTAQRTSLLMGSITLTPDSNVNVSFIFSTIHTLMQNVSAKIIPLVISSLNFLTLSAMRIIILQLNEQMRKQSRNIRAKKQTLGNKKKGRKKNINPVVLIICHCLQCGKHAVQRWEKDSSEADSDLQS